MHHAVVGRRGLRFWGGSTTLTTLVDPPQWKSAVRAPGPPCRDPLMLALIGIDELPADADLQEIGRALLPGS